MKVYIDNIKMYEADLLKLSKKLKGLSFLRLLIFILSGSILIYLFSIKLFTLILFVFPLLMICFGATISLHNKTALLKKHTVFLKKINEAEILREKCKLDEFDTGEQFIDQDHPYTSDLDIFGQHSVFQILNRTTTESGKLLLAEWLSEAAPDNVIFDRQKSIQDLAQKQEWRQDFQASGMHFQNKKSDFIKLMDWVEAPVVLLKYRFLYFTAALLLSVLSLLGLYLFISNLNSAHWFVYFLSFLFVLLVNYFVLRKVKPLAEEVVETSTENLSTLRGYRALIHKIEGERFNSEKLQDLQAILKKGSYSACNEINRLCRILDFSQQKSIKKIPVGGNYFYSLLNAFLLLDIYLIIGTEKWKSKNKALLKQWSMLVSEFEVLNSLAGFCFSNPSYTFPELEAKNKNIRFEALGHPLLDPDTRVCNDLYSEGQGDILMITGSNMGGKSTFLRTVGVNLVLALAGAPCCAKKGRVSNLNLFTSMRTQDNLKKGISSFYAELGRIEKMLKLIHKSHNVFFLLDEMFKGTNSEDRHRGGFSLINQLSKLKSSGIIATHDIELAKIAENKKLVSNYSFNSEIKGNSMIFSYELQAGICNDFNASELMEKSGIEIINNSDEEI